MESEYVTDVEVRDAVGIYFICSESEMRLLCVQVNVCGDGYVYIAVDLLTQ